MKLNQDDEACFIGEQNNFQIILNRAAHYHFERNGNKLMVKLQNFQYSPPDRFFAAFSMKDGEIAQSEESPR